MIPFKKDANSEVIRVSLVTISRYFLIVIPLFTKVHLRRLIWSNTGFPRRGESSVVIFGVNPFDLAISDLC